MIGGGPIGLEAALYARQLGYSVAVYERGRIGEHLQQWGHVCLFSPFAMNSTPLGRSILAEEQPGRQLPDGDELLTGRQHLAQYLEPLARCRLLADCIHCETAVLAIGRSGRLKTDFGPDSRSEAPFRLLLREKQKERFAEADVVLDCSGTYGQHRWLGDGGIPAAGEMSAAAQIAYRLEDVLGDRRAHYAGKCTLVVGGGYSAATTVCALAELAEKYPETWIIWLVRDAASAPIKRVRNDPLRERDRLAARANFLATRAEGNVEFHSQAGVQAVEPLGHDKGFRVHARIGKTPRTFDVDRIIANVGYTPDATLYRELQVHECYASCGPMKLAAALGEAGGDCLQQTGHGPGSLRNPEPDFYIIGAKSYGRNSQFLLRIGFEQVRDVFTLISGDAQLDLYRRLPASPAGRRHGPVSLAARGGEPVEE